ncbi:RDD family protein [Metamycoplasma canadense]|uniref:RDD domain-containing protein n=1 Tax=Metamycoplasma canadense TaxID=29554 RepID=A0A077L5Y5_9BACT|nr:RDD family protein [Metamycoplasma canadense]BAP39407.1 hypothetical protein MCAN360_0151 [Metamycoplasma canadense]
MIIKKNKRANFWIRLIATLIDLLLFVIFAISSSFFVFNYKQTDFYTENVIYKEIIYRTWLLLLILFIILEYILVPIFSNGRTFGMWICKIKIIKQENNQKLSRAIFDRQRLFAFLWIFVFLGFMLISTDAFLKAARGNKLNNAEKLVFAIPVVLSTIAINLQLFLIITNAKVTRLGWNDKFSKTETVWKNKYEEIFEEEKNELKIYPKKRELPKINAIN